MKSPALSVADMSTPEVTKPIDGNVLDRVLLAGVIEHQNEAIETAKQHLKMGLRSQRAGMPKFATECFQAALLALGGLGAS